MKKKLFATILLCLLAVFIVSCGIAKTPEECKHKRLSNNLYEPNCSLEGYVQHVCLSCGYIYKSDFTAPTGHKITSHVVDATCTEEGYTLYECDVCDYSYRASFSAPTGHTLTSKITPQTCTELGYTTYTCSCGFSYHTSLVVPNGHHITTTTVVPTCTADGYDLHTCNNCDYTYKTAFVAMSHTFTETVVAPTCDEEGYTEKTCSVCKQSYRTNPVAPKGHTFEKATVAPSFNETGYTMYTCSCGFQYKGDYKWYSDIFTGVSGNEKTLFSRGVDLSYHNEEYNKDKVDFKRLTKDNVDFVILRLGYDTIKDTKFEEYYAAARDAGLDIGCYIYSYAEDVDTLTDNTTVLLKHLEGKTFEYPIYLDIEDDIQKDLSNKTIMEMCTAYCELLVQNNFFPGIYSYFNFIKENMNIEQLAAQFDVWVAHYPTSSTLMGENYYVNDFNMWQYTDKGSAKGVTGEVDLNICYKDYPAIIKKYGYNGYGD